MSKLPSPIILKAIAKIPIDRRDVASIKFRPIGAFSKQSRLFRYVITRTDSRRRQQTVFLRSNRWPVRAHRVLAALWQGGRTLVPRPLVYRSRDGLIIYQELAGRNLRGLPLASPLFARAMSPVGQLLAGIHQTRVSGFSSPGLVQEIKVLKKKTVALSRTNEFKGAVRFWQDYIVDWWSKNWRPSYFMLTHGDFQASNIIIQKSGRVGLIDFTLSRRFWPASDLATFIVHLRAMGYRHISERSVNRMEQSFLNGYRRSVRLLVWQRVELSLGVFLAAAVLDVAATAVKVYGPKDKNVARLLSYLFKSIKINSAHD